MGDLVGVKGPKVKDDRNPPPNLYLGHFMKPYFRDRVTGVVSGPRAARVPATCRGHRDFLKFSGACSPALLNWNPASSRRERQACVLGREQVASAHGQAALSPPRGGSPLALLQVVSRAAPQAVL